MIHQAEHRNRTLTLSKHRYALSQCKTCIYLLQTRIHRKQIYILKRNIYNYIYKWQDLKILQRKRTYIMYKKTKTTPRLKLRRRENNIMPSNKIYNNVYNIYKHLGAEQMTCLIQLLPLAGRSRSRNRRDQAWVESRRTKVGTSPTDVCTGKKHESVWL